MLWNILIALNVVIALTIIFREKRDVSSTWGWLVVLIGLPGVGLFFYMFIGKKISQDNIFDLKTEKELGLKSLANEQIELLEKNQLLRDDDPVSKELVNLFLTIDGSAYSKNNAVSIFYEGESLYEQILKDIENAKHHIHIQYYIFNNDTLGKRVMDALYQKAKQGVEVLVLYDALGSRTLRPSFFSRLKKYGGQAISFFGSKIPFVNLRMNNRNHRKNLVIDGRIGYTGGFNIGDEYLGQGKLGNWRDTHLRLSGHVVHDLQARFFIDWNAVVSLKEKKKYLPEYYPKLENIDGIPMQLVSSGPESDLDQIKLGYLKMISSAKKSIYLQTPYFIPDQSLSDAIEIAIASGVEVNIMIPCKPDHMVVYRATEYYAKWAANLGANIYIYTDGFLHSKVLVIDDAIASVGTANFDIRSFVLNFEMNVFIYDKHVASQLVEQFNEDKKKSIKGTPAYFKKQSLWKKLKQELSRLASPIL
ncbi:cardiolipin synthase [Carnobacteriaceae bacterium zg-C25]|nr:cardiolipin synthase [Carnobacteriaceae bacterium zg-C25]